MNQKKRRIFRLSVILLLAVLALGLIIKLCGYGVSDWLFVIDSILLIVCGLLYRNYDQAVREDQKFGQS